MNFQCIKSKLHPYLPMCKAEKLLYHHRCKYAACKVYADGKREYMYLDFNTFATLFTNVQNLKKSLFGMCCW